MTRSRRKLAHAACRLLSFWSQLAQSGHDVDERIHALQQWLRLEANTGWLLVMDNVDREWQMAQKEADAQAYNFKDFLSSVDYGSILITTRLARLQRLNASLHLREVEDDVGREMIEAGARRQLLGMCMSWLFTDARVILESRMTC